MGKLDNMMVYALERKIDKLEQQRAELLEALKRIIAEYDKTCDTGEMPYWPFDDAKAAITKAEAAE